MDFILLMEAGEKVQWVKFYLEVRGGVVLFLFSFAERLFARRNAVAFSLAIFFDFSVDIKNNQLYFNSGLCMRNMFCKAGLKYQKTKFRFTDFNRNSIRLVG